MLYQHKPLVFFFFPWKDLWTGGRGSTYGEREKVWEWEQTRQEEELLRNVPLWTASKWTIISVSMAAVHGQQKINGPAEDNKKTRKESS